MNEVALYLILVIVHVFCGLTPSAISAQLLGWSLIGVLIMTLTFNICVVTYLTIHHFRRFFLKFQYKKRQRALNKLKDLEKRQSDNKSLKK